MNFAEAIEYLLSLGHETLAIKLGLRNTELLLEALGNPHTSFQSVQIAGTNGKGSTAVLLESICRASRIPTGLYTSPHLVSITERIRINGADISEDEFAKYATRVRAAAESLLDCRKLETLPTFFEHVTAAALLAFREAGIKLAILETGLGGRLDATTVAGANTIAITPIALDHQEYLGETLAEIAGEKAAIIRPRVIAVIAPQPAEALQVILRQCAESNVEPDVDKCKTRIEDATDTGRFRVTFETKESRYDNVLMGLRGRHQIENASVAIQVAESLRSKDFDIPKVALIEGIETAKYPGRLEFHQGSPSLLLDGAHNLSGAEALRDYLRQFVHAPMTLIFGSMRDKNISGIAATLFPLASRLILTKPDNLRAMEPETIRRLISPQFDIKDVFLAQSTGEAMRIAQEVTPAHGLMCVTGSLYLVGEVAKILGGTLEGPTDLS